MKSNSLVLSVAITLSLLTMPTQLRAQTSSSNHPARVLYTEGRDLLDDGSYVEAEKKFREVLKKYPRAERPDRTSFMLITSLIKQGRTADALGEIATFNKKYPRSQWRDDVEEKRLVLTGLPRPVFRGGTYRVGSAPLPVPPPTSGKIIMTPAPFGTWHVPNPSLEQEQIRIIIQQDANHGIAVARERLKANPTDPAVVSNFSIIASSGSPQAFPFFVVIAGKGPNPHTQIQAQFYLGRLNNEKDAVGKGLVEMMKEEDKVPVVADVFTRSNPNVTRTVLSQLVQFPGPEKLVALERMYYTIAAPKVREQIVQSAGSIPESAALEFLTDVVKNEHEFFVRAEAVQSLSLRSDVNEKMMEAFVKTLAASPARPNRTPVHTDRQGATRQPSQ